MDRFEAAVSCTYIYFLSTGGKLIIVTEITKLLNCWACDISSGCTALKRGGGEYNERRRRTFSRGGQKYLKI